MFVYVLCNTFKNLCEVLCRGIKSGYGFICFGYGFILGYGFICFGYGYILFGYGLIKQPCIWFRWFRFN